MREKGSAAIYSMAGIYVLYMAYQIFQGLGTAEGSERVLMVVFMILFGVLGAGLIGLSLYMLYKFSKDGGSIQEAEMAQTEENSGENGAENNDEDNDEDNDEEDN